MRKSSPLKWFVISAALFTVVGWTVYLITQKNNEQKFSVERLWQERATLTKSDMRFVSRGKDFGHYVIRAVGEKGDTVEAAYRVPANSRKLKSLLWVYDSPSDVNLSAILDGNTRAQHAAVVAYNVHRCFERDENGEINSSRANLFNGLWRTRRDIDLILQLLKKHQVLDSTLNFVAGQGNAVTPLLGALAKQPHSIREVALIEASSGLTEWGKMDESGFATSYKFALEGLGRKRVLIEPEGAEPFQWEEGGNRLSGDILSMGAMAGVSSTDRLRAGIETALIWAVGGDTTSVPVRPDTTFTKVVKVAS